MSRCLVGHSSARGWWLSFGMSPPTPELQTLDRATPLAAGRLYVMVYDGHCTVCGRIMQVFRRWDRDQQLEILPSQDPGVPERFPWIPAAAYRESVQLIGPGQVTWQGAEAMERAIDLMPKGLLISWIFSIPFARPIAERCYRWFARNRYHLGCGDHCELKSH